MRQVGKAYIISPRLCTISKYSTLQGQPLRLSVIGAADTKPQLMIIYPLPSRPTIIKLLYSPRFGIFFLFEKENACKRKAKEPFPLDTRNAAPQYLACGSQSVARHIRAQTRRSLNECALVRLASQAVPSPNPVGFYHCGAAIGSLITKVGLVTYFYFAKVRERVCFYLFKSIESIAAGGQPQGLFLQTVGNRQFENFVTLTRQRCVEVAAPYMLRVNKFVQISRANDICPYLL